MKHRIENLNVTCKVVGQNQILLNDALISDFWEVFLDESTTYKDLYSNTSGANN